MANTITINGMELGFHRESDHEVTITAKDDSEPNAALMAAYDYAVINDDQVTFTYHDLSFTMPTDIMAPYEVLLTIMTSGISDDAARQDIGILPSGMGLWMDCLVESWHTDTGFAIFSYLIGFTKLVMLNLDQDQSFTEAVRNADTVLGKRSSKMGVLIAHEFLYPTWVHGNELKALDDGSTATALSKASNVEADDIIGLAKAGAFDGMVIDGEWYVNEKQFRKWNRLRKAHADQQ